MTIGEATLQSPYRLLLYKSGSLYKCKSGITGLTEIENSSLSTVWSGIKTAIGSSAGPLYIYPNTNYSVDDTLVLNGATEPYFDIWGTGNEFRTLFIPADDFPVFDIQDVPYMKVKNLGFYHNQTDFTSSLLKISDETTLCQFENLYFANGSATALIGTGVGFIAATTGQQTMNRFSNCTWINLDTCVLFKNTDASNSDPWMTSNTFLNCMVAGYKYLVRAFTKDASGMNSNDWVLLHAQSHITDTVATFDYANDNGTHSLLNKIGVIAWDMPSGAVFVKANSKTNVNMLGTTPTYKNGGSGLNNGANIVYIDHKTRSEGFAQLIGTGTQTDWTITHNLGLTPTHVNIIPISSATQNRSFEITSKTTTQFTIRFHRAPPPSGDPADTGNVKFEWRVMYRP